MPRKKAETKTEETSPEVKVVLPTWKRMAVTLVGISPLGMDRYAEPDDPDAQKGLVTEKKIPDKVAVNRALHRLPEAVGKMKYGLPVGAFKSAVVSASRWTKYTMEQLKGAIFLIPQCGDYVPIWEKGYRAWPRYIKKEQGSGSIRKVSPVFDEWGCEIAIDYMENFISKEDVLALIGIAGYSVGVGIFAPHCRCSGPFGRFVATGVADLKMQEAA